MTRVQRGLPGGERARKGTMGSRTKLATITVPIDEGVKQEAQLRALDKRVTLPEVVERFLRAWVSGEISLPDVHDAPINP